MEMRRTRHRLPGAPLFLLIALLLGTIAAPTRVSSATQANGETELWVLVDTGALTLSVMRGKSPILTYENIAIGSNGATWSKRVQDEKTPLGDFRINEIRRSTHFHLFLSFDYPTIEHAERALRDGRLGTEEYRTIREAWSRGEPPPQNTRLGGHLGIHGIGSGSLEIHKLINWTNGCIAVTNEQVTELAEQLEPGTRVQVR